jgi:hypothetical protein
MTGARGVEKRGEPGVHARFFRGDDRWPTAFKAARAAAL